MNISAKKIPQQTADSRQQIAKLLRTKSFCYLLFAICYLLCPFSLLAFNAHQPFDITSDVLTYDDGSQQLTAEGHVTVIQSSSTLTADLVRYDKLHKHLLARGNVVIREKGEILIGDQM